MSLLHKINQQLAAEQAARRTITTSVRVNPAEYSGLQQAAESLRVSAAAIIRTGIALAIEQAQAEQDKAEQDGTDF